MPNSKPFFSDFSAAEMHIEMMEGWTSPNWDDFPKSSITTIKFALALAKKVTSAPTQGMYEAGKSGIKECQQLGMKSEAAFCFAAMINSAIKDVIKEIESGA